MITFASGLNKKKDTGFTVKLAQLILSARSTYTERKGGEAILILFVVIITRVIALMAHSKMAGYQLASDDLTHVPAKFMCKHCNFVLREPLQTPCAHFYCRDCLTCLKSGDIYKCKVDDEEFTQAEVFPDGCVRKEIQQLPVHCSNRDNGCEWKGKLECLEAHAAVCDFEEIACVFENCGQKVRKSRLAEHLETECSQRQVKCEFCNEEMPQASLEEHTKKTCQSFPINCSLCNKKDIPRKELRDHHDPLTGDCEESKTVCPFRPLGCNSRKEMKRKEKQEHEDNLVSFHLSLLVRFVFTLRDQLGYYVHEINPLREGLGVMERLKRTVSQLVSQVTIVVRDTKKMGDEIQGLKTRVRRVEESCVETDSVPARGQRSLLDQCKQFSGMFTEMKRALSNMQANIDNHELLIVEANRTIEEQNNENVWLKRQVDNHKEAMRRLQAKVDSLEEASRTRNANSPVAGLQNSAGGDEANSFDGVLLWRISNVAEKIYEAMNAAENSSYSAPFYTSRHGYKMCARIYLNGDGMGKGTHISLFFVIMRGQYDGLLRWPFRQKVTMMLLDQDNVEHVIDAFRPDPGSSSFQKPRREMNIASGCPLFFPLAELNNHPYIKDDTMFIKIIVDCSDL